jgi:hypothetical protein
MKLQNMVLTKIIIEPNGMKRERSKSAPTPPEIRLRVIEMDVERGGIYRLALDTWQQAHANFKKNSKTRKEKQQSTEMRHRDDIEIRAERNREAAFPFWLVSHSKSPISLESLPSDSVRIMAGPLANGVPELHCPHRVRSRVESAIGV